MFGGFDGTLLEYFRSTAGTTVEPPEIYTKPIGQHIEEISQNQDRAYNIQHLVKRLQRIDKELLCAARSLLAAYVVDGNLNRFAAELPNRLKHDSTNTMNLLVDKPFQKLLINYPRSKSPFIVYSPSMRQSPQLKDATRCPDDVRSAAE